MSWIAKTSFRLIHTLEQQGLIEKVGRKAYRSLVKICNTPQYRFGYASQDEDCGLLRNGATVSSRPLGYIPKAGSSASGGYEVVAARVEASASELLTDAAVNLLRDLEGERQPGVL